MYTEKQTNKIHYTPKLWDFFLFFIFLLDKKIWDEKAATG